ncbi:MAG: sigma-70 family RNA polymerase sigma factor [Acidobacteriota bacterium]|nr:sigma-70 family RNA polymerase sigma factor [Acidobacteriota bacterium]
MTQFAFVMTGSRVDCDDLVAEAFARSWRALAEGEIRDPGSYLRRVIVNEVARRRRWARLVPLRHGRVEPARFEDSHAERDGLLQALDLLPARQRAVVVLRYWEDLSEARTAEVLGISVGAVKSHAHRGLGRLRAILEDRQ